MQKHKIYKIMTTNVVKKFNIIFVGLSTELEDKCNEGLTKQIKRGGTMIWPKTKGTKRWQHSSQWTLTGNRCQCATLVCW
jgi:hypothetical protein